MIDWAKVAELSEEIGPEDFAEVVDLFLEEVDATVKELEAGVPDAGLEDCMHSLKGSALNLGFSDFANLCAQAERAAHDGAYDKIDLRRILGCYEESKARFVAEWRGRIAA